MEDCFLDYCLRCDRQTSGEAYCCQACRLADLEASSNGSEPSSPVGNKTFAAPAPTARSPNNCFFLPPAFDFSPYRRSPPPSSTSSRPTSWFSRASTPPEDVPASPRVLSPSTSRNSLKAEAISSQAKTELRSYTNSFDQVRDWRRKMTTT
ncbi:MAG: hypothetical protein LQ340_005212 [Diploschistes diacapsis]|nr:MAG: hypothetical protein LQ340_005212 [Diploschistes diacapsis]